jgi:hypothetical protein
MTEKSFRIRLALLTLAALALRLWNMGGESFWIDEVLSAERARMPLPELFRMLGANNQTPLYYMMLHPLASLWGNSEWVMRLPSAVFGALSAPAMAWACWSLTSDWQAESRRRAALFAAAFVTFSPYQVYFGQEARTYAMVLFLAGVMFAAMGGILFSKSEKIAARHGALFILVATLGWYAHYTFAVMFGAAVFLLLLAAAVPAWRTRAGADALWKAAFAVMMPLFLFLPWAFFAPRQAQRMPNQVSMEEPYRLATLALDFWKPLGALENPYPRARTLAAAGAAMLAAGLLLLALRLQRTAREDGLPWQTPWLALALAVMAAGYAAAIGFFNLRPNDRYFMAFTPVLVLPASMALGILSARTRRTLFGAWLAWSLAYLCLAYYPLPDKTPWREIGAQLNAKFPDPDERAVRGDGFAMRPLAYYDEQAGRRYHGWNYAPGKGGSLVWALDVKVHQPQTWRQPDFGKMFGAEEAERLPLADFVDLVAYRRPDAPLDKTAGP